MLDQMFNAKNFREIFDAENRKGSDVASQFFPDLDKYFHAYRDKSKEISICKKECHIERRKVKSKSMKIWGMLATLKLYTLRNKLKELVAERKKIGIEKSRAIDDKMKILSENVAKPGFKLTLTKKMGPHGKVIYCTDNTAESHFIMKLLQRNIFRLYKVKQASRHELASRVRDVISAGFSFELVKTDISSFYESVDRKSLYERLDEDPLLSTSSKRFVNQIFDSYFELSGSKNGIPRGVGVSAYLAEIYLRDIDISIGQLPGRVLYCRYVDDIIAIFLRPPIGDTKGTYKEKIQKILKGKKLECNEAKTTTCKFRDTDNFSFDYLGYTFKVRPNQVEKSNLLEISLSQSSFNKLSRRLNKTFEAYDHSKKFDSRGAFKEIRARVKFLTGNSRLKNSKSGTVTGIYYNNPLITHFHQLDQLDCSMKRKIGYIGSAKLKGVLEKHSFKRGFKERVFHDFNVNQFKTIVRAWKYVKT